MDKFEPLIATQEYWSGVGFWILVAGLIGDIAVLAIPARRGRLEKILAGLFTIVVIVACAFEHIADGKIDDLVSGEETAAAVEIAKDDTTAQQAAKQAADLGVTVKTLPDFVTKKEGEINGQISAFQKFSTDVQKQETAAATTAKGDLTKVSNLLAQEQALHDKIIAMATPRVLTAPQLAQLAKDVSQFSGTHFDMGSSQDVEAINLGTQIGDVLKANGWIWDRPQVTVVINVAGRPPFAISVRSGVGVMFSQSQLPKFGGAASALVGELRADNIPTDGIAVLDELGGKPNPEAVTPQAIHIQVGSKR